ncbi:MAG: hypothetical protein EOO38_21545 [Cytophagaceae bacterium]|nr:MAG: hypothetical protein EOO38_21545 [Cytophagaceae bacterium]
MAATWLSFLAGSLVAEFAENDVNEVRDEQVAALAFFSRLASDLWAILEIVEAGFDLQARMLARGFLEHVDVLICCIDSCTLTKEFVDAVEPEQSNAFWHRYVSKNKAKSQVSRIIAGKMGREDTDVVDRLRENIEFAGSTLIHPTVAAGLSTAFGNDDVEYDSLPIFPVPMGASAGVFRPILIHLFWLMLVMGTLPKESDGDWLRLLRTPRLRSNKEIDRFGRLYSRMFGFLLEHNLMMRVVPDEN